MLYYKLIASVLFGASVIVKASPTVPRGNDDFESGFLATLNKSGLTVLCGLFKDYFQTDAGEKYLETLQNGKFTILAPDNDSFDPSKPSLGSDPATVVNYITLIDSDYSKRYSTSRDAHQTLMTTPHPSKRWDNHQVQIIDTITEDSRKRWAPQIFIRQTLTSATVTDQTSYKNIKIYTINNLPLLPTRVDDVLCKPLVESAPNGFPELGQALYKTGLMDIVNYAYAITLFAPTPAAFNACEGFDGFSTADKKAILENHFLTTTVYSPSFASKSPLTANSGKKLKLTNESGTTYVSCGKSKAKVLRSDVTTTNGAVHVIDAVLKCD